ncbi:1-acyl-sn-glycerol-3-phosphate acyltransferase [Sphingomonas baiyangensis]|uniref:1-acyl-sn-glycerol-3-phosphate acyltransferase n=1 Tax=Sphingomonas baiyangensis TaxID=2572576 RepID=A0A4U1L7G3_9SPHN|nr:1-acyl-sn-glycerol-3-phosphate acyltransferase [Sphingomonas baiyangensis]
MGRLRSLLFDAAFYGGSVPIVCAAPLAALVGTGPLNAVVRTWLRWHRFCARHIMGIHTRIEGRQLAGPALYVAKHQSFFETFELTLLLDHPVVVMKRELADVPVWGRAAQAYGLIVVDREASGAALKRLIREARLARAAGRPVLIFAEGTRVAPGEAPPLRAGFAGLYKALDLPAVPIALDSARVWPRHGPKRPGTVTIRFADPIAPGRPRAEAEALAYAGINALEPAALPGSADTAPRSSPPSSER